MMWRARVMPCLLLQGAGIVKTVRFKDPTYLGDPRNAVKIFNEKEVDELILLDIRATASGQEPQFDLIKEMAEEAFMPVAYGGGIRSLEAVRRVISLGVEKVVIGSYAVENPAFIGKAAALAGSSSVVVCIDVKKTLLRGNRVHSVNGSKNSGIDPVVFARRMEEEGAGELVVHSIDRDGTMTGYDLDLIKSVCSAVKIPVIACGGAGKLEDVGQAIRVGGADAAAAGSIFVYQGKHRAVLINFPDSDQIKQVLKT